MDMTVAHDYAKARWQDCEQTIKNKVRCSNAQLTSDLARDWFWFVIVCRTQPSPHCVRRSKI